VTVRQQEKEIRVDVRDNGVGIVPDAQHRIFERFYRGEDPLVLATAGTGLGLAIARTMVEMHHGRIWFESSGKSGEGSVFSFTLPVDESQE
jgi:two-component system sensor histidine kinase VicK